VTKADTHGRSWVSNPTTILIGVVVVFMILVQLPMIKGVFYRLTGASAQSAVNWRTDLDLALEEAAQADRPVLVDFTASWCPPCQVMKQEVWSDETIGQIANERFIPVLVDVDDQPMTAGRYGIQTIPTIMILDSDGQLHQRGDFMSRREMKRFLEDALERYTSLR